MRFKIEYLRESTDEDSVCDTYPDLIATRDEAEKLAWRGALTSWGKYFATAYQIRDMQDGGKIIVCIPFR